MAVFTYEVFGTCFATININLRHLTHLGQFRLTLYHIVKNALFLKFDLVDVNRIKVDWVSWSFIWGLVDAIYVGYVWRLSADKGTLWSWPLKL